MEKEEILLGMELGRLEIEPVKFRNRCNENPFINLLQRKYSLKNTTLTKESKCTCSLQRKTKSTGVHKKKPKKILKDPVLKIIKNFGNSLETGDYQEPSSKINQDIQRCDPLSLCTLVHNCNQLTISSSANIQHLIITDQNSHSKWWKNDLSNTQEQKETKQQSNRSGSCSQQALNPPCDVTIDELASYFETLVHIPKKMSSMAEMMYI